MNKLGKRSFFRSTRPEDGLGREGSHLRGKTGSLFRSSGSLWIRRDLRGGLQGDFSPGGSDQSTRSRRNDFGIEAASILKGVRGERPLDIKALVENLLRLSQLMMDFPEIEGIDINPVKVLEKGAVAVDARILLSTGHGA